VTYDPKWNSLVSAAGYLGLVVFMFILGFIFENGRASAFAKMQEALGQLEEKNEQLVAMNKEKNEFLGIAAHDLKNPLTAIMGSGELLKIFNDTLRTPELADTILAASQRMYKLITNLLDVYAIEEGRFASNLERCDFSDLVRQCVEHNLSGATRKKIEIRVDAPEHVHVKADCTAASQILDNLISNAVKYSPLESHVAVHLELENDYAQVKVHDEGPGISLEDQKKLFQKFSRLSAVPTGGESSTGLGLAIAKRLAEAMAGTVAYESRSKGGSTFSPRLPLWPEEEKAPVVQAVKAVKTGKVKVSIEAAETHYARP
jgi:signal transduction histidine kinase